jgi:hypothetical protein
MIIASHPVRLTYGTDSVAHSLRSSVTTHAPAVVPHPTEAAGRSGAALDLNRLYPAIMNAAPQTTPVVRATRALAFRLSVLGTAAGMLAILHH